MYQALASGKDQIMVMSGDLKRMREFFWETKVHSPPAETAIKNADQEQLREKTLHRLKILLAETIKLAANRIDADKPLEGYGIDSIIIARLNRKIEQVFGELSKTLFFEYRTLGELAEYFIANYPQACMRWTEFESQAQSIDIKSKTKPKKIKKYMDDQVIEALQKTIQNQSDIDELQKLIAEGEIV